MAEQERMIEAILFASAEPLSQAAIAARLPHGCDAAEALAHLRTRYQGRGSLWCGWAMAMRCAPRPIWGI